VLNDPSERAKYDRMLVKSGSRDGLDHSEMPIASPSAAASLAAAPEMLFEAFMMSSVREWHEMLAALTDENLKLLEKFLAEPVEKMARGRPAAASASSSSGGGETTGLIRGRGASGHFMYAGKLMFENFKLVSRFSELGHAIDARIALLQVKAIVNQRMEQGQTFEEGVRAAVAEVRSLEQSSIFWLQSGFEFNDRPTQTRKTTPFCNDLEQTLADRRCLLELQEAGASKLDFETVHREMIQRGQMRRKDLQAQRPQLRQLLHALHPQPQ